MVDTEPRRVGCERPCGCLLICRKVLHAQVTDVMKFDSNLHHRRSIRLKGYDYSQPGAYFVTICTFRQECVLGKVVDGTMALSPYGQIAFNFWAEIPFHFPNVEKDPFVIMPNHVHAIIVIHDTIVGAGSPRPYSRQPNLGQIVAFYKYQTAKQINVLEGSAGLTFWQRNYYDHIIRNELEWQKIWDYIQTNPLQWREDDLFSDEIL